MPRKEKVTKVIDGDTFMTDKRKNPVRLANVDPQKKDNLDTKMLKKNWKNLSQTKKFQLILLPAINMVVPLPKLKLGLAL